MSFNSPKHDLEVLPVAKLLWNYSVPAIIATVSISLYNLIDRAFIGQGVGPYAISGLALTLPVITLLQAFGTLIGVGASSRISIVLGMKDKIWAEKILGNSLVLTFIFAAVVSGFCLLFLDELLLAFGGSAKTIPFAKEYLQILLPGSIFSNIYFSFTSIIRATGYPQKSMRIILIGVVLNIILDPIFIFIFHMGIRGAAIATVISMIVASVFAIKHFVDKSSLIRFKRHGFALKRKILINVTTIGMSPFIMNFVAAFIAITLNKFLVDYGGDLAIGAFGIINSLLVFFIMIAFGLCQGMQPIIGYNYGAGKKKRVKDTLFLAIKVSLLINFFGSLFTLIFPQFLVGIFTTDKELMDITVYGLRICFITITLVGVQVIFASFYQSIGKASLAIFMSLCRQIIFLIPALFLFSNMYGLTGIWIATPVSDILSFFVVMAVYRAQKKIFYPSSAAREMKRSRQAV